jgi:hypothetical protein
MKRNYIHVTVSQKKIKDLEENTPNFINKYNKLCFTNNTIKKPYCCNKNKKKCIYCQEINKSSKHKNKYIKRELNNYNY